MTRSTPPLIGIATYGRNEPAPFSLPGVYIDAVRAAGGIPLLLPPGDTEYSMLLEPLDALLIPGGGDIAPRWYGGKQHDTIYGIDLERDDFELKLARCALDHQLPILGICRGLQILVVASGGKLIPHLPDTYTGIHRLDPEPEQRNPTKHHIKITASESRLARSIKNSIFSVVSWHHQGVLTLSEEWQIVAYALEDELVEAVEHKSHPWAVGIQWHPELLPNSKESQNIFLAFVKAARDIKNSKASNKIQLTKPYFNQFARDKLNTNGLAYN